MSQNISEYILKARRFRPKDSNHPQVTQTVNQLAKDIALGNKVKQKLHLKYLILDLYARYKESTDGWIFYSRDPGFYKIPAQYNPMGIAYRPLIAVVDQLRLYDFLEQKIGFYDDASGSAFQTRIRPTELLVQYFQGIPTSEIKETYLNDVPIRLRTKVIKRIKGKDRTINKLIAYQENEYTDYIKEQVMLYNASIKNSSVELYKLNTPGFDQLEKESTELRVNLNQKKIHRVFNNNFDKGGRFYGGWWQNIPSQLRNHILIDGEPTIEVDFKGFHIALLYALKEIDYFADDPNIDPYKVEGFDRDTVKLLLQTILNADDKNHAKKGFRQARYKNHLPQITNPELNRLIEAFETMHSPIAGYFYKEKGLYLQNLDSKIAQHVMSDFMGTGILNDELLKNDIVQRDKVIALPIHDSFRVQVKYLEALKVSMTNALESAGQELIYFDNLDFYNYTPRFSYSDLIDMTNVDENLVHRDNIDEVIPELKILYKRDRAEDKDYFKFMN